MTDPAPGVQPEMWVNVRSPGGMARRMLRGVGVFGTLGARAIRRIAIRLL
jgi:hypothetical protein